VRVRFIDLVAALARLNEICLGVRNVALAHESTENYGISLNPKKNQVFELSEEDELIVLCRDHS